jgi:hypothetical protein
MKSCRNCAYSRHDGSAHRPNLICRLAIGTPVEVVAAFSASIEENQSVDKKAQSRAQMCKSYEGEAK